MINHFCKKVDEEYMIKECNLGERIRCIAFEERKGMLVEFATEWNKGLTELYEKVREDRDMWVKKTKELTKAKELLRDVLRYIDLTDCVNNDPRLVLYDKVKSLIKEVEK